MPESRSIAVYKEELFVFGSNTEGRHGKGAAKQAWALHGAQYGVGKGRTGQAYAIPTKESLKDKQLIVLPLGVIATHVEEFLCYARLNLIIKFNVTRIGCGLAGYRDGEIAPLFREAPDNVFLPKEWEEFVPNRKGYIGRIR